MRYNEPLHDNPSGEPPATHRRFFAAVSSPPIVLAFAAADPTGGAGVQADLLTLAAMGYHALSVITAITEHDTAGVNNLQAMDPEMIVRTARLVPESMPVRQST